MGTEFGDFGYKEKIRRNVYWDPSRKVDLPNGKKGLVHLSPGFGGNGPEGVVETFDISKSFHCCNLACK